MHSALTGPLPCRPEPHSSHPRGEVTTGVQSGKYCPEGYSTNPNILWTHPEAPDSPKTSHQGCRSITAVQPFDPWQCAQSAGLHRDLPLRPPQHTAFWRQPRPTCQSQQRAAGPFLPVNPLDSFCQQMNPGIFDSSNDSAFQALMQLVMSG